MYRKDEETSRQNVSRYAARAQAELGGMKDQLNAEPAGAEDGPHPGSHDGDAGVSVREAVHRGKHIVVKTTYEVTVDGEPLRGHLGVSNDGSVHYHGLPNYAFASMVDLVREVIDASQVELPEGQIGTAGGGH